MDQNATMDGQLVVCTAVYDELGRVVKNNYAYLYSRNDSTGFDTWSSEVDLPVRTISKIRVYPKRLNV